MNKVPLVARRPVTPNTTGMIDFPLTPSPAEAQAAVRTILAFIGEDPNREGLTDTPSRVLRAMLETTAGIEQKAEDILDRTFTNENADEMIVVPGIRFRSTCEHHLLPFIGTATVAYIPDPARVVGLSKLPRLVLMHAHRLQIQERMTKTIADDIERCLKPRAIGVIIQSKHLCMCGRGVNQPDASMITSDLRGLIKDNPVTRHEFLHHHRNCLTI